MKILDSNIPTGLDRMNGLLAWWGMPNAIDAGEMETRNRRFQILVADLSKLLTETSSSQVEALTVANEQFARALHDLLSARQPPELMAAQSSLVTGLIESLAAQTRAWAELTQKLHDCCSALVREAPADGRDRPRRPLPVKPQGEAEPTGRESGRRAAQG